jgi:Leucine-rich repeat (LRR) protein
LHRYIAANKVVEVPAASISPKLGWLILSDNRIERLPETIGQGRLFHLIIRLT